MADKKKEKKIKEKKKQPSQSEEEIENEALFEQTNFKKPSNVLKELNKTVYCNQKAKKQLINFFNNHINKHAIQKSLFIGGPANTGKAKLVEEFSHIQNIPFVYIDLASKNPQTSFDEYIAGQIQLQTALEYEINEKDNSIKINKYKDNIDFSALYFDISSLIKPTKNENKKYENETYQEILAEFPIIPLEVVAGICTKHMLKIYSFTSPLLEKEIEKRLTGKGTVGFKPTKSFPQANTFSKEKVYSLASYEDLKKAHFSAALVNSVSNIITLNYFNEEKFLKIFELENSYLNTSKNYLEEETKLKITICDTAKEELAKRLVTNASNAGGIEQAIDTIFEDLHFVDKRKKQIVIDKEYVQKAFENNYSDQFKKRKEY
ncbi:MAG: hypothetical protein ACOCQQ_01980 [Candidatus Nanoarchaeia archaeon]